MKAFSREDIEHQRIIVKHRERRRQIKKKKLAARSKKPGVVSFVAPAVFSLSHDRYRTEVLNFIGGFRGAVRAGHKKIVLNLSRTVQFIADATLLFHAEICRIKSVYGASVTFKCTLPIKSKCRQVLKQIGLLDHFSYNCAAIEAADTDVVDWRSAFGEGAQGEKYESILGQYEGVVTNALLSELYTGLTEAMTNAHHHAYIKRRPDGIQIPKHHKPWWMFSQEKDGLLTVVFCDLGVGISETLPFTRPTLWQQLLNFSRKPRDSQVIEEAIKDSRTRTHLSHRGKGLKQIVDAIATENGKIIIHSNEGQFSIINGNHIKRDYRRSIMGTIIFWQLPLHNETRDVRND